MFLIFVKKQSQELTRFNPDRNIFSINVEPTSTFLLYRGLVHHHHRILHIYLFINYKAIIREVSQLYYIYIFVYIINTFGKKMFKKIYNP